METQKKPSPPSDEIDIMRYISLFTSNWIWIAVALFLALSAAYAFNRYAPRIYNVKSTILIDEEPSNSGISAIQNLLPSGDYSVTWRNLENEIAILESYSLNYRVMEEMPEFHIAYVPVTRHGFLGQRMYKTSPFIVHKLSDKQPYGLQAVIHFDSPTTFTVDVDEDEVKPESVSQDTLDKKSGKKIQVKAPVSPDHVYRLGEPYVNYGFCFTIEARDTIKSKIKSDSKFLIWFESPENLANDYRSKLTVKPTKEGASVFILSYTGYSPQQGADYLNKLMERYNQQGLDWKNRAAESTIMFIEDQLGLISDSLNKAENSMENFRLNNRFVDLTQEGSLVLERLEKFENEKNALGLQMQYYLYLQDYLESREQNGSLISPSVMGVTDPALIKLVEEFSSMQQKKKQVDFAMKDNSPLAEVADKQTEGARASLLENVKSGINQLKISTDAVNRHIKSVEEDLDKLPGTQRRLIGIQRKFDLNNSVYTFLLERRAEAGIARASQMSDNRIIDYAVPHNSSLISPKVMKNYVLALVLGLLIPMLLIVLLDLLNNKIIGRHDIEALTKAPILGFISHSDYHIEVPVAEKPGSTLAESFRAVRTSLGFYTGQTKCPVIVVSSPVSGEGKTFVSANLASIFAMMDKKVLIVGLDMRKPRVHTILNAGNGSGISHYLSNNATFEEIVTQTSIDNLFFVPSGPVPPNPAELIGSPRMAEFINRARNEFDMIIIDTPPVGIVTDAHLLGQYANVTLFVIRQRYTTRESVSLLNDIFLKGEMGSIALVVNDISASGYYGYGLRYGYSLGYGHRYYDPGNYYTKSRDKNMGYYTND